MSTLKKRAKAAKGEYRANFLWPHKDGSIEQLGYEFANANTEAYRKIVWRDLKGLFEMAGKRAHEPGARYVASWEERVKEVSRYGLMLGALQGLRYSVDEATRARIDDILERVSEPSTTSDT